jgi:hypothetical protein
VVLAAVQLAAVKVVAVKPDQVAEHFMPTCCCTSSTSRRSNRLSAISVAGRLSEQQLEAAVAAKPALPQVRLVRAVAEADLRLEGLLASATFWTTRLWFAPSSLARTC